MNDLSPKSILVLMHARRQEAGKPPRYSHFPGARATSKDLPRGQQIAFLVVHV